MTTTTTHTVSQLCDIIEKTITKQFKEEIWVEGVISNLSPSPNGHVYFNLIDPEDTLGKSHKAVISVRLFESSKRNVNRILINSGSQTKMTDGIKIRIRGAVNYYPPQGNIQIIMSLIDPEYTLAQMALDKTRLLKYLQAEKLLEKNSRLTLSKIPLKLGLITSYKSDGYEDFMSEIKTSKYGFNIQIIDSRVQGGDAVPNLLAAIRKANQMQLDAIIIIRGGGSKGDLIAFDNKEVAISIANSQYPVITGIGHDKDRSIADEVSHTSTKTPTAAAAFLVNKVKEAEKELEIATQKLAHNSKRTFEALRLQLVNQTHKLHTVAKWTIENNKLKLSKSPKLIALLSDQHIKTHELQLKSASKDLLNNTKKYIDNNRNQLEMLESRLDALDPINTLRRGWSITKNKEGKIIKSSKDVKLNEQIVTIVQEGILTSLVSETQND